MNKFTASILFGAGLLVSSCTVHHYHHDSRSKGAEKPHHGSKGHHELPEGHPPLKGHGSKGYHGMPEGHPPVKGHGAKGHHGMPEGHPPVKGHGGAKGHHGMPEGHPPVKGHGSMKGHHGGMTGGHQGGMKDGHGHDAGHEKMHANLPAEVNAFHESFSVVWHEESDTVRSTAACAKYREWETLAGGVSKFKAQREQAKAYAAAAKTLNAKVKAVSAGCRQKKNDVQAELKAAHDALHGVMKALQK